MIIIVAILTILGLSFAPNTEAIKTGMRYSPVNYQVTGELKTEQIEMR